MKQRADRWNSEAYPFGSEMAWDSTGQEEIFAWTEFFGYKDKAGVALDSILGYMPAIPHWGYNGNARRYWDFIYGGAPGGTIERQIHHYGSGINAIPVLARVPRASRRRLPAAHRLRRIDGRAHGIDQDGFPSAAFHSYPQNSALGRLHRRLRTELLRPCGDAPAPTIVDHPAFGWVAFGGNLRMQNGWVTVQTLDSMRQRVYIAPLGLYLTLDRGTVGDVAFDPGDEGRTGHAGPGRSRAGLDGAPAD